MDFDKIESLSEENLLDLYENSIIEGLDNNLIGYCWCSPTAQSLAHGDRELGGCGLHLYDLEACKQNCRRLNVSWYGYFSSECWCSRTTRYSYWTECGD